jgi:hypothetical protein
MPEIVEHARALGAALHEVVDVSVVPAPPQAAMFHVHARRDAERLSAAALDLAEETKTWMGSWWRPGADPAVSILELSIGAANLDVSVAEAMGLYSELLARSA